FEPNANAAPVIGGNLAANESAAFQPFEQRGNGRPGDVEPLGEFGIAQPLLFVEVAEKPELGDGQAVSVPDAQAHGVQQRARIEERLDCSIDGSSALGTGHVVQLLRVFAWAVGLGRWPGPEAWPLAWPRLGP